jgi:hypothetical protein
MRPGGSVVGEAILLKSPSGDCLSENQATDSLWADALNQEPRRFRPLESSAFRPGSQRLSYDRSFLVAYAYVRPGECHYVGDLVLRIDEMKRLVNLTW